MLWAGLVALAAVVLGLSLRSRRDDGDDDEDDERAPDRSQTGHGARWCPPAPMASPGSAPVPNFPPGVGTPLGRYVLLDRIGEGGMAEIFTAVSFGSGGFRRSFVVKRLRPEMATNPVAVAHFIDEANLASTLVHPNIVPVFDFGEVAGSYFLAQEYIVGRDLGRLTRRMVERNIARHLAPARRCTSPTRCCAGCTTPTRSGPTTAAALELVHRDVTPENVMISERGEVKILDFGIVKAAPARVPDRHRHGEGQRRLHVARSRRAGGRWIAARTCSRPGWCCTSRWPGRRCTGARPCSIG